MALGLAQLIGLIIGGITAAGVVTSLGVSGATAEAQKKSMKEQQLAAGAPVSPGDGGEGPGMDAAPASGAKKKNIVV